jgi:Protein of unknown function (DUF1826)
MAALGAFGGASGQAVSRRCRQFTTKDGRILVAEVTRPGRVAPLSAALFKGVVLAGDHALSHRSPPIAGSGVSRLFLCLNEEAPARQGATVLHSSILPQSVIL